jgi:hypothetical protein
MAWGKPWYVTGDIINETVNKIPEKLFELMDRN